MAERRGNKIKASEDKVSFNRKRYLEYEREFFQIFGVRLSEFMTQSWDFDVLKFVEEFVRPMSYELPEDVVRRKYGDRAVQVCYKLL